MRPRDPRYYQILVLGTLLSWGVLMLGFPVGCREVLLLVGTALATQALLGAFLRVPFDARSPLISALSLCLLARGAAALPLALTAVAAIASKFLIRRRGKHVFNPTNFGLGVMALASGQVWVSPGQWGSGATLTLLLACAGWLVVHRAERSDVTWAFLAAYSALLFGRAWWLGDPLAIPLHGLNSGAFLIFAFFMISDPKTTPDSRAGRITYAVLVAAGAAFVHFGLYRPNGFIWALLCAAPLVPLLDRLLPGRPYAWPRSLESPGPLPRSVPATAARPGSDPTGPEPAGPNPRPIPPHRHNSPSEVLEMPYPRQTCRLSPHRHILWRILPALALLLATASSANAFCGFYVAKADSKLFNRASQVVLARHDGRTVLTMASDFRGDPEEFALVVPVPTFLERDQIHVADQALIDHLDAYTSPRLVEYFDPDPCQIEIYRKHAMVQQESPAVVGASDSEAARALGVTIEASYTVGEYDILILSAEESRGLESWLRGNGYRIPEGAGPVLGSYLKQGMRFFVAKVNLEERSRLGYANLRPLQMAYESPKFMLPIRLGTVNADGPQELFIYTLTKRGRVETTNYRTVRLPTGMDLPVFVKQEFGDFYRDLFSAQVEREGMRSVFLEYAWDMGWCDPCAADPLSAEQLRQLGVFWLDRGSVPDRRPSQPRDAFVTRLHLRYDRDHFPDDLRFHQTADRTNFQGRYVLRHAWAGDGTCRAADEYRRTLPDRFEREAQQLASLTGWEIEEIRRRMGLDRPIPASSEQPWWRRLWRRE